MYKLNPIVLQKCTLMSEYSMKLYNLINPKFIEELSRPFAHVA